MSDKINLIQSKWLSLDQIEPNTGQVDGIPANPRTITPEDYELLKKSITDCPKMLGLKELYVREFGDGFVVMDGNMRLKALRELGFDQAPCKIIPEDFTPDEIMEVIIKANTPFGDWDQTMLKEDWDSDKLKDWGVDLEDIDFEEPDTSSENAHEDDFDETKDKIESKCVAGDIWILGIHRLMCGDSTKKEDVEKLMDGQLADLWITDPPYNVAYEGRTEDKLKIMNDSMDDSSFRSFLVAAYSAAFEFMKAGASFYIWHADSEGYNFRGALHDIGQKCRECLIWVKKCNGIRTSGLPVASRTMSLWLERRRISFLEQRQEANNST